MINEQISDREVRVVSESGEQLRNNVIKRCYEACTEKRNWIWLRSLRQAKPPVCKIIDYGKYRYEQARKEKEAKKKQKNCRG